MPEFINTVLNKLKKIELPYKVLMISGMILVLSSVVLAKDFKNSNTYATYHISESQAKEVADFLKKHGIECVINEKKGLIEVPKDKMEKIRTLLAQTGIFSKNEVGFGIFDKEKSDNTEFLQHINYIKSIQEELAKSIETIRGIRYAKVYIVLPEKILLEKSEYPATASIIISYDAGVRKLSKEQIKGIVNLVANSVKSLKPENVKLIDNFGNVLTDILKKEKSDKISEKLSYKRKIELIMAFAKYGLIILVIVILFIIVLKPFLKVVLQTVKTPEELLKNTPLQVSEIGKEEKIKKECNKEKPADSPKEILTGLIKENPQEIAKHVQRWIRNE